MADPNPQNERRLLLAIGLSMVVVWTWSTFFAPEPLPVASEPSEPSELSAPVAPGPPGVVPVVSASPATCTGATVPQRAGLYALAWNDCGGSSALELPQSPSPLVVTPWWSWIFSKVSAAFGGADPGPWVPYAKSGEFEQLLTQESRFLLPGRGAITEAQGQFTATTDGWTRSEQGIAVRYRWNEGPSPDLATFEVTWTADRPMAGPFWVAVVDNFKPVDGIYATNAHLAAGVDGSTETLLDPTSVTAEQPIDGPVDWFGVGDRYFVAAVNPDATTLGRLRYVPFGGGEAPRVGLVFVGDHERLEAGQSLTQQFSVYIGPKRHQRLAELGEGFESAVDLGFFGFFARIVLFTLDLFYGVMPSWGWAIVALTFLVRASLYPLARKAFQSGKQMQAVQPLLKELQEKYKDDKEKQSQETMKLFQQHGVNPLGGCLPMLFQIPVFFALVSGLTASPDLYGTEFLYLQDLSMQDPYGVLGVLIVAGMYVQQQFMPTTGMDPTQAQMLKFMPIIFGVLMFSYPAGLSVYYVVNTLLSILQQWYNTREIQTAPPSLPAP